MQPIWLASTVIVLAGVVLILMGHFYGGYSAFLIFGVIILSLGMTISLAGGGVRNGLVLVGVFAALVLFLTAVDVYDLWGLAGWI